MTIIVAVRKGNFAAIAGDLQTSQGSTIVPGPMRLYPRKIHRVGQAYVGIVGCIAHHNVFRSLSASKPELLDFKSGDDIFETLRSIHPLLREQYYVETNEDDNDQEYESSQLSGLVISKAGIFSFMSYREVTEYDSFWAAGSGKEFALGALEATYASGESAKSIAEIAVTAACKFDSACGLPLESYELELEAQIQSA